MQYKFTYALYSYQPNSYMPHQLNILWAFKEFAQFMLSLGKVTTKK